MSIVCIVSSLNRQKETRKKAKKREKRKKTVRNDNVKEIKNHSEGKKEGK
jgi:hypothetical protein